MPEFTKLSDDLYFLKTMIGDRKTQYGSAFWLKSPFEANKWICEFGTLGGFIIDFEVELGGGNLLTAPRSRCLLDIFKYWLCLQTHNDATGGVTLAPATARNIIGRTLHLIDYFLLNAVRFRLIDFGLEHLCENDIIGLLVDLSSSNEVANSVYNWPQRLTQYLKLQIPSLSQDTYHSLIEAQPFLKDIENNDADWMLGLTADELIKSRILLWSRGFYLRQNINNYRFTPNTAKLSEILYFNTLRGNSPKPVPYELCLGYVDNYVREYSGVPVRSEDDNRINDKLMSSYKDCMRSLGLLAEIQLPVPLAALRVLDNDSIHQSLNLKNTGRFRTLPQNIVFSSLRHAIEFVTKYGDELIDSYLSIVSAAKKSGYTCQTFANLTSIDHLLTPKIREMGVKNWRILTDQDRFNSLSNTQNDSYYSQLRANYGLWELLRILYGAIQLCVGTLMARRQAALLDLIAGKCLDISETRLIFYNRKSGIEGKMEKEARPIPAVAVKFIKMLERLQGQLIEQGVLGKYTNLFCYPSRTGTDLVKRGSSVNYNCLDIFCDYFEIPLNQDGKRYYIRHHQLRRFFAMLFFWGSSFGNLDTLRWFLCHTDVEHLYHYITESTTGLVLKSVKANYAAELAIAHNDETKQLSDLLELHFGTRNFSILDNSELDEYIEELMDEGVVDIEPEFFETPEGQSYRVLIKVTPKEIQ